MVVDQSERSEIPRIDEQFVAGECRTCCIGTIAEPRGTQGEDLPVAEATSTKQRSELPGLYSEISYAERSGETADMEKNSRMSLFTTLHNRPPRDQANPVAAACARW